MVKETADEVISLMERLNRERNHTFVIVTHAPEVAARCHRTIYMSDGLIVREEREGVAAGG